MQSLKYTRWWLIGGAALLAFDVIGSVFWVPGGVSLAQDNDKVVHATVYFILMFWFAGILKPHNYLQLAAGLVAVGGSLEVFQYTAHARSPELMDLAANIVGIGVAWLVARLGMHRWCQWVERFFRSQNKQVTH
ncbi:MAG: VanZ family protein [Gammaproteobacteria bacterium]|nr:VanZ family protein [Gammaproteobacteria bacterium]